MGTQKGRSALFLGESLGCYSTGWSEERAEAGVCIAKKTKPCKSGILAGRCGIRSGVAPKDDYLTDSNHKKEIAD